MSMTQTDAINRIPERIRFVIYLVLVGVALLLSALGVFLAGSPWGAPWWIAAGLQSVGVLAAPFGVLAAVNVPKQDDPPAYEPAPGVDPDAPPNEVDDEPDETTDAVNGV